MAGSQGLPYEGTVADKLAALRGATVHFLPLGGNNGDRLIDLGSRRALALAGVTVGSAPESADAVVINGGGAMAVESWEPRLDNLRRLARLAPDRPLILLPSSVYVPTADIGACFEGRRAPVWLFARDRYSLAWLQRQRYPVEAHLGIDHDMAFTLRGSELLAELAARAAASHVLLVERFDHECSTGMAATVRRLYPLKRVIPEALRASAKSLVASLFGATSSFADDALQRLRAAVPAAASLPVLRRDISFVAGNTFQQFLDAVAGAAAVGTTRLHVGILAALLGKPTLMWADQGPYRKIRGVFEHSLSAMPHVVLRG